MGDRGWSGGGAKGGKTPPSWVGTSVFRKPMDLKTGTPDGPTRGGREVEKGDQGE